MNQIRKYNPVEKNYTKVSNDLIHSDLEVIEKMIMIFLYSLHPEVEITHKLISDKLKISERTVYSYLKSLETKKLLSLENKKVSGKFYTIYNIFAYSTTANFATVDFATAENANDTTANFATDEQKTTAKFARSKNNTNKNKTKINTSKKTREKLSEQSKDETKTLIQKLQDIAVNNLEILESQFFQLYKTSSNFDDGIKNLETNINFLNSHKSYYENFKARLNHATQNNYLLILNSNDLLLKEKFEEQQRSKFTNQVITDLRLIEQNKLRSPNISIYTNFFKSMEIIALNVDSVRIEFTSFIFKTFLYKEYKDIQIDENYQNKLTELISKVSIENLLNIVDDFMNMKDYSMQRIFTAGAKDLYLLYKENKKEVMTNIEHNLLKLTKKGM